MNLTTLNVNEGWPMQSQFYYNTKLNTNSCDMFVTDKRGQEYQYDRDNSPNFYNNYTPNDGMSEAFCDQNYHTIEQDSSEYNPSDKRSRSCVRMNLRNEPNFCSVDTSNSNCPMGSRTTSYVTNYNHFPLSNPTLLSRNSSNNDSIVEKKFISELHINIKEPIANEGENKIIINNSNSFHSDYENYTKVLENKNTQKNGYHLSSFETFIPNQSESEMQGKNNTQMPEIRSLSMESPNRKREFHHSEKFIYLGCDAQMKSQDSYSNNDGNSYHSPTVYEQAYPRPVILRSMDGDNNRYDQKSFSTKSIQTSMKLDCLIKTTCDRSVETDNCHQVSLKHEENNKVLSKKNICHERILTPGSDLDNASLRSKNSSEIRHLKCRLENAIPENLKPENPKEKAQKYFTKELQKSRCHPIDDPNQDTFAGSYSETLSHSNDLCEPMFKERLASNPRHHHSPLKHRPAKTETQKGNSIKNNDPSLSNKTGSRNKPKKVFSERKEIMKANNSNSHFNDLNLNNISKDTDRHSLEIQCLLDNLNTHLQNTVISHNKSTRMSTFKNLDNQYNNVGSFWDNPLNPETTRSLFMCRQVTPKKSESLVRQKPINPEIQDIFERLEKPQNHDKYDNVRMSQKKSPRNFSNLRTSKIHVHGTGDNSHTMKMSCEGLGSTDNLNESKFPSNLKFQKSFDLSPYDELVKSHLNMSDRRIKSVAAKNDCRIVIDGPVSMVDPTTTCQAIRNRIAYRCVVAGPSKDRLDKCLNYLKETFPNTCLKLYNRNNIGIKM